MSNFRARLDRLFAWIGDGRLFGGANVEHLARGRFFSSPEVRVPEYPSSLNTRKLGVHGHEADMEAPQGPQVIQRARTSCTLAKLGLTDPVSLDQIRERMLELASGELGFPGRSRVSCPRAK